MLLSLFTMFRGCLNLMTTIEQMIPCLCVCIYAWNHVWYIFVLIIIQVHHVTCTLGLLSHVAPCIKTEDGLK